MRKIFILLNLIFLMGFLSSNAFAVIQDCGEMNGMKITTYGGLRCNEAKAVYGSFGKGQTPKGWTCVTQSVGQCSTMYKGFYFRK